MKGLDNYINKKSSEAELEAMTEKLLQSKFDKEQKDEWAAKLKSDHQISRTSPQRRSNTGRFRFLTAIAAAIALLLVAVPMFQSLRTPEYQKMADAFLQESTIPNPVVRKGDNDILETRRELAGAINDKDYKRAVELASQLVKTAKPKLEDHFFLGMGQLYQKEYESAINSLTKAGEMAQKEGKFEEEIRWYLSLAYLKSEKLEDAYLKLGEIVRTNGWQSDKAAKLLKAIQE